METYQEKPIIIENKVYKAFYGIFFVVFIITSITVYIITGFAVQAKVNASNSLNIILPILQNSYILSGDCWSCDAKTGELDFISAFVENDLSSSDSSTTGHFPTNRHNTLVIPNTVVFNNLQFLAPLNLMSSSTAQTTTLYFGNMSKIASPGVSGLPINSRSTIIINAFNGDTISENSRCLSFTNPRIYIVSSYNNILNITNYNLCICPGNTNSNIPQKEFCVQFN